MTEQEEKWFDEVIEMSKRNGSEMKPDDLKRALDKSVEKKEKKGK